MNLQNGLRGETLAAHGLPKDLRSRIGYKIGASFAPKPTAVRRFSGAGNAKAPYDVTRRSTMEAQDYVKEGIRRAGDRRSLSWRSFTYGAVRGRRERERRYGHHPGYIDRYGPAVVLVTVGAFAFGCLDAYLTLLLLAAGASEVNPFLDLLLHIDVDLFLIVKLLLMGIGLLILVLHKNFTVFSRFSGQGLLYGILALYGCLIAYQWALLSQS
jgi:hypothetical protein